MLTRRTFGAAAAGAAALSTGAMAQAWPSRTLKLIVPFAPGGTSDFIARLIAPPLAEAFGQPVIVENKPGAAGNLGAGLVAAANDGHTLLLSDLGSLAIGPLFAKDLPFKLSDLRGVALLGYSPHLLAVHPKVAASNLKELAELSKTKPLNAASAGPGSPNHLGIVEIALATGMKWQHIPYRGGAQALTDTIGGATDLILNGMVATQPYVAAGQLKLIGVSKRTRFAALPDAPTIAEQGMPGFESGTYQGVTAPASLPDAAVEKLNAAMNKALALPDVKKRMEDAGAEVVISKAQDVSAFLTAEAARWESVIKRAGAEIDGSK